MSKTKYDVPSVAKAISVLECLHDSDVPMGITEISRVVGLNKNMVFRLLKTLERRKWVVQNDNCKYRIALRPFFLFAKSLSGNRVHQATHAFLHDLWRNTGESCYVAVLDDDRAFDLEEYGKGMMCFAAPLFSYADRVVGSLGMTALTLHYTSTELIHRLGPKVMAAAREVSAALGADQGSLLQFLEKANEIGMHMTEDQGHNLNESQKSKLELGRSPG